jgi:hypothetical protein
MRIITRVVIVYIVLAALFLAVCSTGNAPLICMAITALLAVLVGRTKLQQVINNFMLVGAGLGWLIGLGAYHLALAIEQQGLGIEMWRGPDSGLFLILFGVCLWVAVVHSAAQFIPPSDNQEN